MRTHTKNSYSRVQHHTTESVSFQNVAIWRVMFLLPFFVLLVLVLSTLNSFLVTSLEALGSLLLASAIVTTPKTGTAETVVLSGGYVSAAIRAVESEKEHVEAERDMFLVFAEEVQSLSTANDHTMEGPTLSVKSTGRNRLLNQVRDLYRETIMSTSDFETEYGESFRQHVVEEFDHGTAALLLNQNHLNELTKNLIAQQARQAAKHRERLLQALTIEKRSLDEASTCLKSIRRSLSGISSTDIFDRSFSDLIVLDEELRTKREQCRSLAQKRQQDIHTVNCQIQSESKTITQEHTYANLEVSFPVLSTTINYIDALSKARSDLIRAIILAD